MKKPACKRYNRSPTGFFGAGGDDGFDETPTKSSVYGTCAHSSSMDQNEKTEKVIRLYNMMRSRIFLST